MSNIFSDVVLGEVVYDDKFDFSFLIHFKKISEELVFFVDSNKEYSINNVSAQLENFSECDKQSNVVATTKLVFDSEKLAASNFVFLDNQLKACNVVTNQVTFVFEKELSKVSSKVYNALKEKAKNNTRVNVYNKSLEDLNSDGSYRKDSFGNELKIGPIIADLLSGRGDPKKI